jgi:hypothetical protein
MVDLPDFEDMQKLIDLITSLSLKRATLDYQIKLGEARVYREANSNPKYFVSDKPPSISAIKATFEYSGLEGELMDFRKQLIQTEVELSRQKYLYELMKDKIEVWRSEQANNRSSVNV